MNMHRKLCGGNEIVKNSMSMQEPKWTKRTRVFKEIPFFNEMNISVNFADRHVSCNKINIAIDCPLYRFCSYMMWFLYILFYIKIYIYFLRKWDYMYVCYNYFYVLAHKHYQGLTVKNEHCFSTRFNSIITVLFKSKWYNIEDNIVSQ